MGNITAFFSGALATIHDRIFYISTFPLKISLLLFIIIITLLLDVHRYVKYKTIIKATIPREWFTWPPLPTYNDEVKKNE
jgi:hypothetical protein